MDLLFDKFQKVVGFHQGFVIHKPEAGFMRFLNDLGLVAADVSHNPVRADARVATKVDNNEFFSTVSEHKCLRRLYGARPAGSGNQKT